MSSPTSDQPARAENVPDPSGVDLHTNDISGESTTSDSIPRPTVPPVTFEITDPSGTDVSYQNRITTPSMPIDGDWSNQKEYIIFRNQIENIKKSNMIILRECKESKRLLDLKYGDLTNRVNRIQTSVIVLSTVAGFFNATKVQFAIPDEYISVMSISISTYVSLVLSVSKYYKYDETKENIQNLREKYSQLHNQIEHRMDVLGPWYDPKLWRYADPQSKFDEWSIVKTAMDEEYRKLIESKKELTTQFEITMDTKARNEYGINNRQLTYSNREKMFNWEQKELQLDAKINDTFVSFEQEREGKPQAKHKHDLYSSHEKVEDNWDDYNHV